MDEDIAARLDQLSDPIGASQRLIRLYREIGLAAIACEFDIELDDDDVSPALTGQTGQGELAA
jgi:hypothetical protein